MSNKDAYVQYWLDTAQADYATMEIMYANKQFHWTLFLGHLVIEKMLKALLTQNTDIPIPQTHDLTRLVELSGVDVGDTIKDRLDVITTFNLSTRYPDYKNRFYQSCTQEYTTTQINIIKDLYQWLKSQVLPN